MKTEKRDSMKKSITTCFMAAALLLGACNDNDDTKPQFVTFADSALHEYIIGRFDNNGDGRLSTEEAGAIRELDLRGQDVDGTLWSGLGIKSLAGIEKLPHMEKLDCSYNAITSANIGRNLNLKVFNCSNNEDKSARKKLSSIDVSACPALEELYCSSNSIATLNLARNTSLKRLDCKDNPLTGLNVTKNEQLVYLNCYGSGLNTLDVTGNTLLEELVCWKNSLAKTLDLTKNKYLKAVDCRSNLIEMLLIPIPSALEDINAGANQLTGTLDVSECLNLKMLNTSGNTGLTGILVDVDYSAEITKDESTQVKRVVPDNE